MSEHDNMIKPHASYFGHIYHLCPLYSICRMMLQLCFFKPLWLYCCMLSEILWCYCPDVDAPAERITMLSYNQHLMLLETDIPYSTAVNVLPSLCKCHIISKSFKIPTLLNKEETSCLSVLNYEPFCQIRLLFGHVGLLFFPSLLGFQIPL